METPKFPLKTNPLLDLTEKQKGDLFYFLRETRRDEVIQELLAEFGLTPPIARDLLDDFFVRYAEIHWSQRIERAASEANALIRLVQEKDGRFSEGMLAVLGQEAFRQIASGTAKPDDLTKYTALFLRAKEQDRAERALHLQEEKLRLSHRTQTERALDAFARDLPDHPDALRAFEHLRSQLLDSIEHLEN